MKKTTLSVVIIAAALAAGCAKSDRFGSVAVPSRTDVFEEVKDTGGSATGFTELFIVASLKTHKPGIYSEKDSHGTADYKLLVNIDGQPVQVQGRPQEEKGVCPESRHPEGSAGVRYNYCSLLRLKPGAHRMVVALPEEGVVKELKLTLKEGRNVLVLEPVYGERPGSRRPGAPRIRSFSEGIKDFEVTVNDGKL